MRTALQLLFLLALAAVPGSLLPQRAVQPLQVQRYLSQHQTLGPFLDRLSLFDVFAAPWFAAIYALLFISLVGCLVPRIRLHLRQLRAAPPKAPAHPARLRNGASFTTELPPAAMLEHAGKVLRRGRYRVRSTVSTVSAEKGYLRETGNLMFHVSLVVLLAAIGLGSVYGYSGTVLVVAGDGFTNGLVSYDQFKAGRLINTDKLKPFSVHLDRFDSTYQANGEPSSFAAIVSTKDSPNSPVEQHKIRVNDPLAFGSSKVYLIGHGYAPRFTVRNKAGQVIFSQYVPCTPQDSTFKSVCTVKVPDTGLNPAPNKDGFLAPQQLAFQAQFFPTAHRDPVLGYTSTFPGLKNPAMTLRALSGDLHLDAGIPQNVYSLDLADLRQVNIDGPLKGARAAQVLFINDPNNRTISGLPGGMTMTVDSVQSFVTFQVKSDPYKDLALLAAVLIVVGLLLSLRIRRRRVWVRVKPQDDGRTLVELGGLSRTEADGFDKEFAELTRRMEASDMEQSA
jgi:cytochrome c biogenesis protein